MDISSYMKVLKEKSFAWLNTSEQLHRLLLAGDYDSLNSVLSQREEAINVYLDCLDRLESKVEASTNVQAGERFLINLLEHVETIGDRQLQKNLLEVKACFESIRKVDHKLQELAENIPKQIKQNLLDVQKKTGMIFQEFNLVNNLSAINNVLTGLLNSSNKLLSLFYLFTKDQKIDALKSLETVGLLEKSYNRSDELSGGQRQRVGIARAIIKKPLLLLADEPVASLDPKAADLILSLLKKVNKEFGTTILCNLHQVDLAKKYSDRLVGLLDGKIIFDEKSENINKSNLEKIYV